MMREKKKIKNSNTLLSSREKEIVEKYRELSEENKLTIDILITRLLKHEKGGGEIAKNSTLR